MIAAGATGAGASLSAAEISGSDDTAAALAVSAVAAAAAVHGGVDLDGEQCTCFAHAAALPRPFSSPSLRIRLLGVRDHNLWKLQWKVIGNECSKK
jgi:hypothetical protein